MQFKLRNATVPSILYTTSGTCSIMHLNYNHYSMARNHKNEMLYKLRHFLFNLKLSKYFHHNVSHNSYSVFSRNFFFNTNMFLKICLKVFLFQNIENSRKQFGGPTNFPSFHSKKVVAF